MKDQELQELFEKMNFQSADEFQIDRWQKALQSESRKFGKMTFRQLWWQWLVAGSIGFACATMYFHSSKLMAPKENFSDNATYEYVYSK